QASAAPATSPRARAHHDQLRARGAGHNAALRQLAHRPAGTLHGCLKTRTPHHQATAWPRHTKQETKPAA
ncbi:MAG TPA: IS110 family transposase, partial [Streptosporangiaceae bacterium]|nr:IS110 family transposase [Streptosporangiaceae bacterium]